MKPEQPMHVEPFERDRYLVTGRSGTQHLVDLNHEGKPACSCHRFNENTHYKGQNCQHILRAIEWAKENTLGDAQNERQQTGGEPTTLPAGKPSPDLQTGARLKPSQAVTTNIDENKP